MKYKFKVLVTWRLFINQLNKYKKILIDNKIKIDTIHTKQFLSEKDLLKVIKDYHGVVCGDDQFTKKVLTKAKNLKVISKWGTGLDSIDLDYAKKVGIKVYNSPGGFTVGVAQLAIAMLLAISRNIINTHNEMNKGEWPKLQGFLLSGRTLGIIGYGKIGQKISQMISGFEMKVVINDKKKISNKILKKNKVFFLSKKKLIQTSDIIILCVDLNKSSKNLIDYKDFFLMKKNIIIINISRGQVINQKALLKFLKNKKVYAVGLDVFENEPLEKNNKLFKYKNCIYSSHNAFNTYEDVNKVHENTIKNLIKGLNEKFKDI